MNAPRRCDPDEVISLYTQGLTQGQIASRVGVTQTSIGKLLRRNGIHASREPRLARRYTFDEDFFSSVTTPEQAYWLGFLAADGYVIDKRHGIGLAVAVKDAAHLELFRSALSADGVPLCYQRPSRLGGNGLYGLRLHSVRLAEDAARYGIIPEKTERCEPWDAPPELAPHYWRGLIDGDGHVAASGRYMSFCGTLAMVEAFRSFAAATCGTRARPGQVGSLWHLHVMGRGQVHAMLSTLYREDAVGLARKKELALRLTAEPYSVRTSPPCRVEGCPDLSCARQLCKKHYQRWKKHGDPMVTRLGHGPDGRFCSLPAPG